MQQPQQQQPQPTLSTPLTKQQILNFFNKHGYTSSTMINQQKMYQILNTSYSIKTGSTINQALLDQIWNQSQSTSKGQISINTISEIVIEAQNILMQRITNLNNSNGIVQQLDNNIHDKQNQLNQYMMYYSDNKNKINSLTKELINLQIQQKQNINDLQNFKKVYQMVNKIFGDGQNFSMFPTYQPVETQYIYGSPKVEQKKQQNIYTAPNPQPHQGNQSKKLLFLFYLTIILFIIQMLLMTFLRVSMITLTVYLYSFYVLLIGIVTPNTINYLLVHCFISIKSDILCVILAILRGENFTQVQHSSITAWWIPLLIVLIITIILRIIFIVILVPYRKVYKEGSSEYFTFMGETFTLHHTYNQSVNQQYTNRNNREINLADMESLESQEKENGGKDNGNIKGKDRYINH